MKSKVHWEIKSKEYPSDSSFTYEMMKQWSSHSRDSAQSFITNRYIKYMYLWSLYDVFIHVHIVGQSKEGRYYLLKTVIMSLWSSNSILSPMSCVRSTLHYYYPKNFSIAQQSLVFLSRNLVFVNYFQVRQEIKMALREVEESFWEFIVNQLNHSEFSGAKYIAIPSCSLQNFKFLSTQLVRAVSWQSVMFLAPSV